MKKGLTIILALVAVAAIIFGAVSFTQKGELQKQADELNATVTKLNTEISNAKKELEAVKSEAADAVKAAEESTKATEEAAKAAEEAAKAAEEAKAAESSAKGDVSAVVNAGQAMTHEELVEKAQAETGTFVVYGNTSRISTAAEEFAALYNIPYEPSNLKDQEIYTKLRNESGSGAADMVMIQDGAQLTDAIAEGLVINFVPASMKDALDAADQQPALVHQYINKLFIYNNKGDNVPAIKNVWELTAPEMKGNVIFKNPENEKVNMNFLVMCTKPEWADKLAEAYKAWKGEDVDLGSYKNAGYKWVAEFLANVTFGKSDTSIAEEVSQETATGKIGLFVLSKLRSSSVLTDNLTVAQYDATANGYAVEPFAGFMYPMYTMVNTKATRPYTAMLFIEYLMTQDGFKPWGKSIGAYSPNPAITVNDGDLTIDVWKNTLVMEDADYILENFEVEDFILQHCQK